MGTGIPVTKASVHEKGAVMRALSVARFVVASLETAGGRQRRVSGRDPLQFRPLVPCCVLQTLRRCCLALGVPGCDIVTSNFACALFDLQWRRRRDSGVYRGATHHPPSRALMSAPWLPHLLLAA